MHRLFAVTGDQPLQPCSSQSPKSLASAILAASNLPFSSLGAMAGPASHGVGVQGLGVIYRALFAPGPAGSPARLRRVPRQRARQELPGRRLRPGGGLLCGIVRCFGLCFGVGLGESFRPRRRPARLLPGTRPPPHGEVFLVQDLVQCHDGGTGDGHGSGRAQNAGTVFQPRTSCLQIDQNVKENVTTSFSGFRQAPPKMAVSTGPLPR